MWIGFKKTLDLPAKEPTARTQDGKYSTTANDSGIDHANMQLTFGMGGFTASIPNDPPPPWSTSAALMLDGFLLPPAAGDH